LTDSSLERLITSVGRKVFVTYFKEFADETLSNQEVADILPYDYTLKSRLSRTSHARSIIRQGRAHEALGMIRDSRRLDPEVTRAAAELLLDV
jgi:hypothetical protein